jgi:flagellar operon protein (TIGR03826 family)
MMDLRNCPQCGKVFRYTARNLCPDCLTEEEKYFERVRDFLDENPGAKLDKVEEATGVSAEKILKWLREGRLISKGGVIPGLVCERCGAPVVSGRLCGKCSRQIEDQIKTSISNTGKAQTQEGAYHLMRRQKPK